MCVVGIAKLEEQLLLLVVADHTFIRDGPPHVLVAVDIYHARDSLDTHSGKRLLHITFEGLCLVVIDTVARGGLHEEVAVEHLLERDDVAVVE